MPLATPIEIRKLVIRYNKDGVSKSEIARRLALNRQTVRSIISRFAEHGDAGLLPRYDRCGPKEILTSSLIYRSFCALRRWHPKRGYDYIRSEIMAKYPTIKPPDRRTVYRWWHQLGLVEARTTLPRLADRSTNLLHHTWQVDAKEKMKTKNGNRCCWLNIVDEGSGMVICPPVFPLWRNR